MQTQQALQRPLSRRAFLRGLSLTASVALMAACGPPRGDDRAAVQVAFGPQATPQTILPSPVPQESATPGAAEGSLALDEFLLLSTLLTGVPNLSPELGQRYLQTLNAAHGAPALTALYEETGLRAATPPTTATLSAATAQLNEAPLGEVATALTKLWYSGIYTNAAGEATVATFVDALAWKTLAFTKPTTICGVPGFWSEAWEPVLD
jgi:hypothetical protein